MDANDQPSVRRGDDERSGDNLLDISRPAPEPTTVWRMGSATLDNQASCSVTTDRHGCNVLVLFTKGLGVPEHFDDLTTAVRHSMEIAGRLTAQGWVDIDLLD
jgi:hypothetical protein